MMVIVKKVLSFKHKIFHRELFRTYSIYNFGAIVDVALTLFILPLFALNLPKSEFGVIGLLWIINPILGRLITLGMDVSVSIKFFKFEKEALCIRLYHCLQGMFINACLFGIIGILFINVIQKVFDDKFEISSLILLLTAAVGVSLNSMMLSFLTNNGQAVKNVFAALLQPVLNAAISSWFVLHISKTYESYLWSIALANGICGIVALFYFIKFYPIPKRYKFSLKVMKELLYIGLPTVPSLMFNMLLASSDRFLIKHFLGLEAVAIYTFGYRFAEYVSRGLFQPFQKAFSPVLFKQTTQNETKGKQYHSKVMISVVSIFSFVIVLILVFSKEGLFLLGGRQYQGAYLVFVIAIIGTLYNNIVIAESGILVYYEKTKTNMLFTGIATIINIGLNILFIPKIGVIAAAISTVISYMILLYIQGIMLKKTVGTNNFFRFIVLTIPVFSYVAILILLEKSLLSFGISMSLKIIAGAGCLLLHYIISPELRRLIEKKS
jgi:O-antigen/teichoic acid export membrane protein